MKNKTAWILFLSITLMCCSVRQHVESPEVFIHPTGWNLPDIGKLTLVKTHKERVEEISETIIVESYEAKNDEYYEIENAYIDEKGRVHTSIMLRERGIYLWIYKDVNGRILGYKYSCIQDGYDEKFFCLSKDGKYRSDPKYFAGAGVIGYFADMDGDGIYESCFEASIPPYDHDNLIYILKNKKR